MHKIWITSFSNVNITSMEQYSLKALFMEYYNEPDISYQIVRKSNITSEG